MNDPREVASPTDAGGKPWGPWATVGFGGLILLLWVAAQGIVSVKLTGWQAKASDAAPQGWIVAWAAIISAPVAVGAAALLASLRKGISVAAYLGLAWPPAKAALRWAAILLGLIVVSDLLSLALGRPLVPESMVLMYETAGSLPLLLIGLIVAAPLAEEFVFRGFLLAGLLESRLGPATAIALTALAWGSLHLQYDLYGMATVAVAGVLLGLIRWRTGSLWLTALLHGLMNTIATVEVLIILSRR
ncbi:MAG TPA: CPBP family intramembrane glutamic endopeptidase [Polyangiaceae bacterium]|nr:CPBP family intramembrane glutamic endopeptidase [Polyangiaceae bacterium]